MEGILPYRSSEFEVNPRIYQPWRDTEEIENMMIQKMVDQTLMSVLSTVSEEVSMDKSRSKPVKMVIRNVQYAPSSGTSPLKPSTKNKKERRPKKGRREEAGSDVTVNEPMISVPASKFKSMVLSEVESRATRVHDYYSYQWNDLQRDRLQLYGDFIRLSERDRRLEAQMDLAIAEIHCLQNENEKLKIELDDIKNAKKKKRKDARLRRNKDKEQDRQADSAEKNGDTQERKMSKEEEKDEMAKDGNKKARKGKHGKTENTETTADALQTESNRTAGSKILRDKSMLNKLLDLQKEATSNPLTREMGTGDDGHDEDGCVTATSIVELNFRSKGVALKSNVLDKKSKEVDKSEDYEGLDSGEPAESANDVSKSGVKKQGVGVEDELR
ncbi:myb-like protein X [Crassostrea angulata]|uniref:myb-like protein X n=1 Tax=Magallana angulata TaxID=2784310 RepID=UPI0022B0E586|nr:myb-like protein X [Crassostrea angulata]